MMDRARDDNENLWHDYAADKNNIAVRNELIEKYLFIVRIQVSKLSKRVKGAWTIEKGDLFSGGTMGLMKAIDGFEPDRGFQFVTYATKPVRGGILDALRAFDPLSRTRRRRLKHFDALENEYAHAHHKFPSPEELIETGEHEDEVLRMIEARQLHSIQSLDQLLVQQTHTVPDAENSVPLILKDESEKMPDAEITDRENFYAQLKGLPERKRLILLMHFGENIIFDDIADSLGVTPSRISQLYSQSKRFLRSKQRQSA